MLAVVFTQHRDLNSKAMQTHTHSHKGKENLNVCDQSCSLKGKKLWGKCVSSGNRATGLPIHQRQLSATVSVRHTVRNEPSICNLSLHRGWHVRLAQKRLCQSMPLEWKPDIWPNKGKTDRWLKCLREKTCRWRSIIRIRCLGRGGEAHVVYLLDWVVAKSDWVTAVCLHMLSFTKINMIFEK